MSGPDEAPAPANRWAGALARLDALDGAPWPIRAAPPAAVALVVALAVLVGAPAHFADTVKFVLLALVTPIGQEVWLVLAPERFGLPLALVALVLYFVNLSLCLFFAVTLPVDRLVVRIPRIGKRIARLEARIRSSRFMRRGVAFALAVVVVLPFHSGGAVLGSLAGRSLGLPWPATVVAVMAGVTVRLGLATAVAAGVLALPGL